MPYCTIEEAWANSLTQDELKPYSTNEYDLTLTGIDHKPYKTIENHSRTYNKLPEHSGPETRHKPMPVEKKPDVFPVSDTDSHSDSDDIFESSSSSEEMLNNEIEKYKNDESDLKNLIKENKNLKKLIKNLKKNRALNSGSNKDFALYVFSGLVVIIILENFRKIYKRF
jgi:hypothetical protein|tara:strand:+ start:147 stop:653 length:507 start_codon:yes stop_codon:yes gene_type:complete